ncbi:hypothetical protein SNEBB_008829 [Seison nebaliae]|nr:hypothetical protein SNEBB_008829 [Seison nebaliae]
MASNEELSCVYASLILAGCGAPVTKEGLQTVLSAAGSKTEAFWVSLFASALDGVDVKSLLTSVTAAPVSTGGGQAAAGGDAGGAAVAEEKEEKKEESEDESDEDMGFDLFEE